MQPSGIEFIQHILEETEFCLQQLTERTFDAFVNDGVLSRAIVRNLEIIGEASKKVPDELRNKYPEIEWTPMAKMRDLLIHRYFGVDYNKVYRTVINDLPQLKKLVNNILEKEK